MHGARNVVEGAAAKATELGVLIDRRVLTYLIYYYITYIFIILFTYIFITLLYSCVLTDLGRFGRVRQMQGPLL